SALNEMKAGFQKFSSSITNDELALLVDYEKDSTQKRAYWLDLKSCSVITEEYVIHGGADRRPQEIIRDGERLKSCKNRDGSRTNQTRPGFMLAGGCHTTGKDWPRIAGDCAGVKLRGLEDRNSDVLSSGVVIHEHVLIKNRSTVQPIGQGCLAFPKGRLK